VRTAFEPTLVHGYPLQGTTYRVVVDGPTQGYWLEMLWETLLQRLLPERAGRAEVRASPTSRQLEQQYATLASFGVAPRSPDRMWNGLYQLTEGQLPFPVHAALWAPYAPNGTLPREGLHAHMVALLPEQVFCRPDQYKMQEWLRSVSNTSVPLREFTGGQLRMRCRFAPHQLRDRDNLLHCPDGPAVVFEDGTQAYFWRGTHAPAAWFPEPTKEWRQQHRACPRPLPRLTPHELPAPLDGLTLNNIELRRVACELLGWDAIVSALKPTTIDVDPDPTIGTLLRVKLPGANPWEYERMPAQQFLRVQCGTGRTFSLAVPPEMRTARQANAWTYGLEPDEYAPEVRT
jgi:hypothetical protein